jgi:AcrR family transcriptional regulator
MPRPKSDGKRKAILEAAFEVFAERGVHHAPTSAISQRAGVAEGTLFTYFATKDELLNELYLEMRRDFDREITEFPREADICRRLRYIWDTFLNIGIREPRRLTVMRQLRATGRLLKDNETAGVMVAETLHATRAAMEAGAFHDAPVEFMVLLLRAHAEATIEFIVAHPELEVSSREQGFQLVWRGLSGK